MAPWVPLSSVRFGQVVADRQGWPYRVCQLPLPNDGNRRDNIEGTRKPLSLWFRAMWLITSQKNGISALALQRQLGLTRYDMVWTWLHKLRRAMVRPGRERLSV